MFLPSLQLVAPSLWFLSSLGLAQFNPSSETPAKTVTEAKATKARTAPKVKNTSTKDKRAYPNTSQSKKIMKKQNVSRKASQTNIRIAQISAEKTESPKEKNEHPTTKKVPSDCNTEAEMKSDVSCVIAKIQTKYRTTKSITADFTQTYTYAVYQRTQVSKGKVFLKSPGRMRWDYQSPTPKVFVADGTTLWVYEPTKNQAYKRPLTDSQLPVAIRFLMGEGNLLKEFVPEFISADATNITVRLTPKTSTNKYKKLTLVIGRTNHMVKETTITDPVNNTNRVRFDNTILNKELPDAGFKFVPPEGVDVLR